MNKLNRSSHCDKGDVSEWSERFGGAALVTGAASGIGEAFAVALAARGMDLVLVDWDRERLEALALALEAEHRIRAEAVVVDLAQPDAVQAVRAGTEAAGLSIGLLINNVGYGVYGPFTEQDPVEQAGMVDVNCRAPVMLTRAFTPDMVARRRGGIVFVSSTAAYQPTPHFAVYAATKVFDLFLVEALWGELTRHGVEVLGLSPGHTRPTRFSERAGDPVSNPPGGVARREEVVATALAALGQKRSVIHGLRNVAVAVLVRVLPRTVVIQSTLRYFEGLDLACSKVEDDARDRPRPPTSLDGRFARAVARMLIAFLAVSFIDLVVCSLLTHKLRFWFPAWIDARWDSRPDSWVTYSQSYVAGIVFIPMLAAEVIREFVPKAAAAARTAFATGTVAVLAFIVWWKGGLMLQYHKEQEAVAWVALTAVTWGLIRLGEKLPARMAGVTPLRLAAGLARGVAVFFLVMAVVDPVLCVGVQGLPWSKGLIVEMGFFVPAGFFLWALARRLSTDVPEVQCEGAIEGNIAGET
ncbi:MAG: SDR family NAD(P)-dependent oxidoreductase [Desulfuromonadales bacterium]|nr:MAG: SDR family NAD(P)-dependent oxidoreductase [Desulfuromonadales bacterium]